ncbi:MAG: hypothetical protein P1P87_04160 [Trueperaceae bacterium]|nr:hypothetical protein [Trueperaceae bacterium]
MDLPLASTAFATIVSLIGQFRSERSGRDGSEYEQFQTWLIDRNHEEIRTLLDRNQQVVDGLRALLAEHDEALGARLEALDKALATFASGLPGFGAIAASLRREAGLSAQALSLLRQFEASGASTLVVLRTFDGIELLFADGHGGAATSDMRFLEDDLRSLADVGLLRPGHTPQGYETYLFTRAASDLVRSVSESE